jgi:hypothetical protein
MKYMARIAVVILGMVACGVTASAQPRTMGGVGITVFEDINYKGGNSTFVRDVPSLASRDLGDRISSLRVGPGEFWEVCEDENYRGRCQVVSNTEADLRRSGWNDRISSMRRVSGSGGSGGSGGGIGGGGGTGGTGGGFGGGNGAIGRLELFNDRNFSGRSSPLTADSPRLGSMSGEAESLRLSGRWEICDREDFRGSCRIVTNSVPDLSRIGWKNRIRSARPR